MLESDGHCVINGFDIDYHHLLAGYCVKDTLTCPLVIAIKFANMRKLELLTNT